MQIVVQWFFPSCGKLVCLLSQNIYTYIYRERENETKMEQTTMSIKTLVEKSSTVLFPKFPYPPPPLLLPPFTLRECKGKGQRASPNQACLLLFLSRRNVVPRMLPILTWEALQFACKWHYCVIFLIVLFFFLSHCILCPPFSFLGYSFQNLWTSTYFSARFMCVYLC